MKLSNFGFTLPEERLAEHPAENRDEARLMVLNRATRTIEHKGSLLRLARHLGLHIVRVCARLSSQALG